jgi:hypothetical protein
LKIIFSIEYMPSEWISHVKQFQAQHGCSYKDALRGASASYRSMKGGNIIKTAKSAGKQLINAGTARAIRAINGSGVNRLKKAQRWEHFADSTLHDAIDTANKARKTYQKGMGVNRLKKAQRWEHFADSTLHDAIDTANKARKTYQKGMGLKHHRKLSGQALYVA